jgi:signal peptidase I
MANLRSGLSRSLLRWHEYRALLLFLLLMLGFRSAWADWVTVPSGSMNPTILEGDRLLIDKHVFGLRVPFSLVRISRGEDPARGDIVVFDSPLNGQSLVKRVAAVPGDTLELDGEILIINGQPARYRPGDLGHLRQLLSTTASEQPAILTEQLGGRAHEILLLPARTSGRLFGPVTVPAGMYFMLGDNRDNSADSRYIGFVARVRILGRASRVVVSFDPEHYFLPRWNRLLLPLT